MPTKKSAGVFVITSLLTMFLSATVMLLAPLPARFLRLHFGRWAYWIFALISTTAIIPFSLPWALSQFILLLSIGLYTDLEEMKVPMFYAGLSSVVLSGLSFLLLLATWSKTQGRTLTDALTAKVTELLALTQKVQNANFHLEPQMVVAVFPALVAISIMMIIFLSVIFIKPAVEHEKLTAFKVPEALVWPFIFVLAGTFLIDETRYFWLQKGFSNALYVFSAAYYFQGLSIVGFFLKRARVHYLAKAALFMVLILHLFIFVAAFGLSDVWFSYRSKFYRKIVKNNP